MIKFDLHSFYAMSSSKFVINTDNRSAAMMTSKILERNLHIERILKFLAKPNLQRA